MKELSIEDKAKRYDEAIIKFKPIYDLAKEQGRTIDVKEFENIFPELKKFEDDGIREWLIGYFNQYIIDGMPQVFCNGLNVKDVIAWLEKQGEQKSIEWSGKIGVKHAEGKLKEMLDKKEKPAWSEEDSAMLDNIVAWIEGKWGTLGGRIGGREKFISFLKSLKDRYTWKPSEEQMEALDDFIYAKYPNIEKYGAAVKSLYQDLKKLIGE